MTHLLLSLFSSSSRSYSSRLAPPLSTPLYLFSSLSSSFLLSSSIHLSFPPSPLSYSSSLCLSLSSSLSSFPPSSLYFSPPLSSSPPLSAYLSPLLVSPLPSSMLLSPPHLSLFTSRSSSPHLSLLISSLLSCSLVLPEPELFSVTRSSGVVEANCTTRSRPASNITWTVAGDNRILGPPTASYEDEEGGTTRVTSTLLVQSGLLKQLSITCFVQHPGLDQPLSVSLSGWYLIYHRL